MPKSAPKPQRWDAILSRLPADRRVGGVEVGVWQGRLSEQLLRARPHLILWLVDRWLAPPETDSYYTSGARMALHPQRTFELARRETELRIAPYPRRAFVVRAESTVAARRFPDHGLDFVFLDGDHSYDGVSRDLRAWAGKVRPGGWIGGHDWRADQGGVEAAVLGWAGARGLGAVELDDAYTWFRRIPG